MKIDCATCPARNRACDGCVMQVLFSPSTRDFGPDGAECGADPEMFEALDVFTATALISPAAARAAKARIDAGQSDISGISGRRLKAV